MVTSRVNLGSWDVVTVRMLMTVEFLPFLALPPILGSQEQQ